MAHLQQCSSESRRAGRASGVETLATLLRLRFFFAGAGAETRLARSTNSTAAGGLGAASITLASISDGASRRKKRPAWRTSGDARSPKAAP